MREILQIVPVPGICTSGALSGFLNCAPLIAVENQNIRRERVVRCERAGIVALLLHLLGKPAPEGSQRRDHELQGVREQQNNDLGERHHALIVQWLDYSGVVTSDPTPIAFLRSNRGRPKPPP